MNCEPSVGADATQLKKLFFPFSNDARITKLVFGPCDNQLYAHFVSHTTGETLPSLPLHQVRSSPLGNTLWTCFLRDYLNRFGVEVMEFLDQAQDPAPSSTLTLQLAALNSSALGQFATSFTHAWVLWKLAIPSIARKVALSICSTLSHTPFIFFTQWKKNLEQHYMASLSRASDLTHQLMVFDLRHSVENLFYVFRDWAALAKQKPSSYDDWEWDGIMRDTFPVRTILGKTVVRYNDGSTGTEYYCLLAGGHHAFIRHSVLKSSDGSLIRSFNKDLKAGNIKNFIPSDSDEEDSDLEDPAATPASDRGPPDSSPAMASDLHPARTPQEPSGFSSPPKDRHSPPVQPVQGNGSSQPAPVPAWEASLAQQQAFMVGVAENVKLLADQMVNIQKGLHSVQVSSNQPNCQPQSPVASPYSQSLPMCLPARKCYNCDHVIASASDVICVNCDAHVPVDGVRCDWCQHIFEGPLETTVHQKRCNKCGRVPIRHISDVNVQAECHSLLLKEQEKLGKSIPRYLSDAGVDALCVVSTAQNKLFCAIRAGATCTVFAPEAKSSYEYISSVLKSCSGQVGAFIGGAGIASPWMPTARSEVCMARGFNLGTLDEELITKASHKDSKNLTYFISEMQVRDTATTLFDTISFAKDQLAVTVKVFDYKAHDVTASVEMACRNIRLCIHSRLSDVLAQEWEAVYSDMGRLHNEELPPQLDYTAAKCVYKIGAIVSNWQAANEALLTNAAHFQSQFGADAKIIGLGTPAMRLKLWFSEGTSTTRIFSQFFNNTFIIPEQRRRFYDAAQAIQDNKTLSAKISQMEAKLSKLQPKSPAPAPSPAPQPGGSPNKNPKNTLKPDNPLPWERFVLLLRHNSGRTHKGLAYDWFDGDSDDFTPLTFTQHVCCACLDSAATAANPLHNCTNCTSSEHAKIYRAKQNGKPDFDYNLLAIVVEAMQKDPKLTVNQQVDMYLNLAKTGKKTGACSTLIDQVWESGQDINPGIAELPDISSYCAHLEIEDYCLDVSCNQKNASVSLTWGIDCDECEIQQCAISICCGDQAVGLYGPEINRCNFAAIANSYQLDKDAYLKHTQAQVLNLLKSGCLSAQSQSAAVEILMSADNSSASDCNLQVHEALEDVSARCQASTLHFNAVAWNLGIVPLCCIQQGVMVRITVCFPSCQSLSADVDVPVKLVLSNADHLTSLELLSDTAPTLRELQAHDHPWNQAADIVWIPCCTANDTLAGLGPVVHPQLPWTAALLNPTCGTYAPTGKTGGFPSDFNITTTILRMTGDRALYLDQDHPLERYMDVSRRLGHCADIEELEPPFELPQELIFSDCPFSNRIMDRIRFLTVSQLHTHDSYSTEINHLIECLLLLQLRAWCNTQWSAIQHCAFSCLLTCRSWHSYACNVGFPALGRRLADCIAMDYTARNVLAFLYRRECMPYSVIRQATEKVDLFLRHLPSSPLQPLALLSYSIRRYSFHHDTSCDCRSAWLHVGALAAQLGACRDRRSILVQIAPRPGAAPPLEMFESRSSAYQPTTLQLAVDASPQSSGSPLVMDEAHSSANKALPQISGSTVCQLFVDASRSDLLQCSVPDNPTWLDLYKLDRAIALNDTSTETQTEYEMRHGILNRGTRWYSTVKNRVRSAALRDDQMVAWSSPSLESNLSSSYSPGAFEDVFGSQCVSPALEPPLPTVSVWDSLNYTELEHVLRLTWHTILDSRAEEALEQWHYYQDEPCFVFPDRIRSYPGQLPHSLSLLHTQPLTALAKQICFEAGVEIPWKDFSSYLLNHESPTGNHPAFTNAIGTIQACESFWQTQTRSNLLRHAIHYRGVLRCICKQASSVLPPLIRLQSSLDFR